jgi:uncharacterized protein (DUF2236 family)
MSALPLRPSHRINAERLVVLSWPRAVLLQIAHPLIAAGVARHSSFNAGSWSSLQRLHQTVRAMRGLTFGDDAEQARIIDEIRTVHRRVHGVLAEGVGPFPAGTAYSAEDPALLLWVHATVLESNVVAYEALVAPLSSPQRDTYCSDGADAAIALGVRAEEVPRTWADLVRYLDATATSGVLRVGPDARAVAAGVLHGRLLAVTGPVGAAVRLVTAGWLPASIRAQYGLPWDAKRERRFRRVEAGLHRARGLLPRVAAFWPEARRKGL